MSEKQMMAIAAIVLAVAVGAPIAAWLMKIGWLLTSHVWTFMYAAAVGWAARSGIED